MFKNYFKTAWRSLLKNKGYSFLNIFGLAIGIACAGFIFLWVEDETTFDNTNVKKDRLYELEINMTSGGNNFTMNSTPRPMRAAMKAEIPGIANTARYSDNNRRLLFSIGDESLYATGRYTNASLFSMFTFHFVQGNARNPFLQLYSLLLPKVLQRNYLVV